MATIDQVMRGLTRFADAEVIPHLPGGKGVGAGIALALLMDGGREQILRLREHPTVKLMRVMDEQGNVDIDRLYNVARPRLEQKMTVTIPLLGDFTFNQNDVDKLYRYIQEA